MCIYCGTSKYRKIYKNHFGSIPKDTSGRSYEIHHIDGNHYNNEPSNLKAVSIQEHYDIHYSQEDWYACLKMAKRINSSPNEISELARKNAFKLVDEGTHPFLGGAVQKEINFKRINNGTHNFLKRVDGTSLSSDRVKNGTHHFLGEAINQKRIENGTHNFLGSKSNNDRLNLGIHPSQVKKKCEHCNKILDSANYGRYHGDKCSAFTGVKHVTKPHKRRERIQCEVCLKIVDSSNFKKYNHGLKCEQLPK